MLQFNTSEKSVVAKRLCKDYMVVDKLQPHKVTVTKRMGNMVKGAHARYKLDEE